MTTYPLPKTDFRVKLYTKNGYATPQFKRVMTIVGRHIKAGGACEFIDETQIMRVGNSPPEPIPETQYATIKLRK